MAEKQKYACGKCVFYRQIVLEDPPKGYMPRGWCHFFPPSVYPIPVQQESRLAMAAGQQAPGPQQMAPYMIRPLVMEDEMICGQFMPAMEYQDEFPELHGGECGEDCEECDGSCVEGDCSCGS
jgi:hypothetical protein